MLWEFAPRYDLINPLFTSYPSTIWPTFLEMLNATPQQRQHPHPHLGDRAGDGGRLHRRDGARHRDRRSAVVVGSLYKVLDPYLVVANAMPKTAFVPLFYIWLGATLSIYGMSLAISLFITILMIYSGFQGIDPNKIKLAQTFGATKGQILTKVVLPGSVPTLIAALKVNAGLSLVGVVVGEFQSATLGLRLSHPVRQPDLQDEHRDDRDHDPGDRVVADVPRDLVARSRGHAPALARCRFTAC